MRTIVGILVLSLALPAAAEAACGGTKQVEPKRSQKRVKGRPPLAIGDSVMLLALEHQIRTALRIVGRKRTLGLVTPRELGGGSGRDAANVRWAGRRFGKRVRVLDWVRTSRGRGRWFQPDGLHLTFSGAFRFARLIARALPLAGPARS